MDDRQFEDLMERLSRISGYIESVNLNLMEFKAETKDQLAEVANAVWDTAPSQ